MTPPVRSRLISGYDRLCRFYGYVMLDEGLSSYQEKKFVRLDADIASRTDSTGGATNF